MKNKNYIKAVFLCLLAMTVFSSCLKDKSYVDFKDSGALIDLPSVPNLGAFQTLTFAVSPTLTTYPVLVNVSAPNALSTPVNVVMKVDADALTAYNTKNSKSYLLLPSTGYSISNYTVTIPANQTSGTLTVSFNTSVATAGTYVLPLTIASTDQGTISQYKTVFYRIIVK